MPCAGYGTAQVIPSLRLTLLYVPTLPVHRPPPNVSSGRRPPATGFSGTVVAYHYPKPGLPVKRQAAASQHPCPPATAGARLPGSIVMPWLSLPETRLYYEALGRGPALVFAHGA